MDEYNEYCSCGGFKFRHNLTNHNAFNFLIQIPQKSKNQCGSPLPPPIATPSPDNQREPVVTGKPSIAMTHPPIIAAESWAERCALN